MQRLWLIRPFRSLRATGQWLRALATSKENGRFLDLGMGTSLSACWILDGMDAGSMLLHASTGLMMCTKHPGG